MMRGISVSGFMIAAQLMFLALQPAPVQSAGQCSTFAVRIINADWEEVEQVASLTICPNRLELKDISDTQVEPRGIFENSQENGSLNETYALPTSDGIGYWVQVEQAGNDFIRCMRYTPGRRWQEYVVTEHGMNCNEL